MTKAKKAALTDEEVLALIKKETEERERQIAAAKAKAEAKMIAKARENLAKYGTALPPAPPIKELDDGRTVFRVRRKRREYDPIWDRTLKVCPRCGKEKLVGEGFGVIVRNGKESAAGWCYACRNETQQQYRKKKIKI